MADEVRFQNDDALAQINSEWQAVGINFATLLVGLGIAIPALLGVYLTHFPLNPETAALVCAAVSGAAWWVDLTLTPEQPLLARVRTLADEMSGPRRNSTPRRATRTVGVPRRCR